MKKIFLIISFLSFSVLSFTQTNSTRPNISLKWGPAGLYLGNIALQAEYNFGKNSLTAKIGIPVSRHQTFRYDDKNADFNLKSTSFLAGYRTYPSKKRMAGLYFEPYSNMFTTTVKEWAQQIYRAKM